MRQKKLHNELIRKDIDALEREKIHGIRKYNILNILKNVGSIFSVASVNEVRADSIKKVVSKLKRIIEYAPKDDALKTEEKEKIIDIVERILFFNRLNQSGQGLKILTSNQMLSRLSISLAQLKARNIFEKLKKEIRQLLYSLYKSKELTKNIYKSFVDII